MPSYSDEFVNKRVSSGKDKNRASTNERLFAQATQPPHDDDAAAMQRLSQLAGDDSTGGWATNDARNHARMLLNRTGANMEYSEARDGGGLLGSIGGVLKKLAPAAALIPGVGPLAAGGLSALANTGGSLMSGGGLDLGGSIKDALLGAAGSSLLGGQGVKGIGGIPGRLGLGGAGNAAGSAASAAPGGVMAPGGGLIGTAKAAGSAAGGLGGVISKLGGIGNVAKGAAGVAGFLGDRASRKSAERFGNAQLALRQRQLGMAEQDYASRAPLRNAAFSRLGQMASGGGSSIYGRV